MAKNAAREKWKDAEDESAKLRNLMTLRSEKLSGTRPAVKSVARTTRDTRREARDDESSKEPFVIVINGTENASSESRHSVRARIINRHASTNNALCRFRFARNLSSNHSLKLCKKKDLFTAQC